MYTESAATPACEDNPAGTDVAFLEGGEEAGEEDAAPAPALPPVLPSGATAAPVLLQVPTSAQAEDALLSAVISPPSSLRF